MITLGKDEIAKYPFLADAGQYLKDKGFTLQQFGIDPVLKIPLEKAFDRVQVSADGKIYKSDLIDGEASDIALENEVFSFLYPNHMIFRKISVFIKDALPFSVTSGPSSSGMSFRASI